MVEQLNDLDLAIAYLNDALLKKDTKIFGEALRNVIEIHAPEGEKQNLLSEFLNENEPEFASVYKILKKLGMTFILEDTNDIVSKL